jgi:hypothetical protein
MNFNSSLSEKIVRKPELMFMINYGNLALPSDTKNCGSLVQKILLGILLLFHPY